MITTQMLVTVLIGLIAPIAVGLVTKASTSAGVKAVLLLTIAALVGVGQGFVDTPAGETWNWQIAVFNAAVAWVAAVATHFGLYKPTGVSATAQKLLIRDRT